jgi:putative transposase
MRGKKVHGRKRFVAVDTPGLVWALLVVPAGVQDRVGGIAPVEKLRAAVKLIRMLWGDTHFDTALRHAWCRWGWSSRSWWVRSASSCRSQLEWLRL